jgi:hypothetical protein
MTTRIVLSGPDAVALGGMTIHSADYGAIAHLADVDPDDLLDIAVCLLHEAAGAISRSPAGPTPAHLAFAATLLSASAASQREPQPSLPISPAARAAADQILAASPTPLMQLEVAYETLVRVPLQPGLASLLVELSDLIAEMRRTDGA